MLYYVRTYLKNTKMTLDVAEFTGSGLKDSREPQL